MKNLEGPFLKGKYWDKEEFRAVVEKSVENKNRMAEKGDFQIPQKPAEKVLHYLERLERVTGRRDPKTEHRGGLFLKKSIYPKHVIKPENISDEYIKGIIFGNFAEQKGYERGALKNEEVKQHILAQFKQENGQDFESYQIPQEERERVRDMVVSDQKARLQTWLDYLISEEVRQNAPAAFRYWAFAEMLKLGSFDEDRKVFNKRTENTAASFPELDQQALSLVFTEVQRKLKGEPSQLQARDQANQAKFRKLLQSEDFGKLYAFALEHVNSLRLPTERLMITKGEWSYFPKGSPVRALTATLEGFNTKWCIAGEGYAQNYLSHSDIWIYYSEDQHGKNTIPRACIVDSKEKGITEVRGIMSNEESKQHLDSYITPIVAERLNTMPSGKKWQSTMEDMKQLVRIHFKYLQNEPLGNEDLRFLYEIDRPNQISGYGRDPRIEEIRKRRNIKTDLSMLLDVPAERISITKSEALKGNIAYHYGGLDLFALTSAEGLKLPESLGGGLYLSRLTSAEGLKLPKSVGGDLDLSGLTSAKGLKLPESVGGYLDLSGLTSAEGLKLPESLGGGLYLNGLTSAEGLELPKSVGGDLYLLGLTSAQKSKLKESYPQLAHKII